MRRERLWAWGFVLSLLAVFAVATHTSIAKEEQSTQPTVVAQTPAIEANGRWSTNDGKLSGKWEMEGRVELAATGGFIGSLLLHDFPGFTAPVQVHGSFDRRKLSFEIDSGSTFDVEVPAARLHTKVLDLVFDADLQGVKIEGTFTDRSGVSGQWQGWWTTRKRSSRQAKTNS